MHLPYKCYLVAILLFIQCGAVLAQEGDDDFQVFWAAHSSVPPIDRFGEPDSVVGSDQWKALNDAMYPRIEREYRIAAEKYKKLTAALPLFQIEVLEAKLELANDEAGLAVEHPDKYGNLKQDAINKFRELIGQLPSSSNDEHHLIAHLARRGLAGLYFKDPETKSLGVQLFQEDLDNINWKDMLRNEVEKKAEEGDPFPDLTRVSLAIPAKERYVGDICRVAQDARYYIGAKASLPLNKMALEFSRHEIGEESESTIRAKLAMVQDYVPLGDFNNAQITYDSAHKSLVKLANPSEKLLQLENDATLALARSKYSHGEYLQEIELLKSVYIYSQSTLKQNNTFFVIVRNELANAYLQIGDYSNAIPLLRESLDQARKEVVHDSDTTTNLLVSIGDAYQKLGQYDLANPYYEESISIEKRKYPSADLFCPQANQFANALNKEESPLANSIRESLRGKKSNWAPECDFWTPIAILAYQKGDLNYANDWLAKVVNAAKVKLGEFHPQYAAALLNQIEYGVATKDQRINSAISSIAIGVESNNPEIVSKGYFLLSKAYEDNGELELSILTGKIAVNLLQRLRTNVSLIGTTELTAFLSSKRKIYVHLIELLINGNRVSEAQQVMRMLKEEEYFDFIRRGITNEGGTSADYSNVESQAVKIIVEAEDSIRKTKADSSVTSDVKRDKLNNAIDVIKSVLQKSAAQIQHHLERKQMVAHIQNNDIRKLSSTLGKQTAIIQFVFLTTNIQVFLTTHGQTIVKSILITKPLKYAIANLIDSLEDPSKASSPYAKELYQTLISPEEPYLNKWNIKTIMLSLDGDLRRIPFAALNDGEHYLIEKYSVTTFSEVAENHLSDKSKNNWMVSAFGVTKGFYPEFKPLPSVKDELDGIVRHGETGTIPGQSYLDDDFTESHFRESSHNGSSVFHVASHFKLKAGLETESFLLLGNGARLSLADLRTGGYSFSNVELMTLSACDTAQGGGTDTAGREIDGFSALVQKQGAKSVLASLWAVADNSTALLMKSFYSYRTRNHMSKADALRQAQLDMISGKYTDATKSYSRPYYWAPFILMGNWL